jgi:Trypsin-co-occurring domain 1
VCILSQNQKRIHYNWQERTLSKIVPVQLDNGTVLYIEAQDESDSLSVTPQVPNEDTGEQRRGGAKGIGDPRMPFRPSPTQSMQMVQSTIRTYTTYCLDAFKNFGSANVDEVTLEFGVNLSADAGIPYIASGKAQSNLKITVKCSYNKPGDEDGKAVTTEPAVVSNGQPFAGNGQVFAGNGPAFASEGQWAVGDRQEVER